MMNNSCASLRLFVLSLGFVLVLLPGWVGAQTPAPGSGETVPPLFGELKPGPHTVGSRVIHLKDSTRLVRPKRDYAGAVDATDRARQISLPVWYPAADTNAAPMTFEQYIYYGDFGALDDATRRQQRDVVRRTQFPGGFSDGDWQRLLATPLLARRNAREAAGNFPLVLGELRPLSTSLTNEYLASHSYFVTLVEGDNSPSALPQEDSYRDLEFAYAHTRTLPNVELNVTGTLGFSASTITPPTPAASQTPERFVYTRPEVARVTVQKNLEYRQVEGQPLRFDFYRLPVTEKPGALPVAIVMNGFGDPKQKENLYQIEWAKLFAAAGMAGVTFESHRAGVAEDLDALVAYLRTHQDKLGVAADRVVVHASSGHASLGLPIFMDQRRTYLKGVVMNYSGGEVQAWRTDLPVLFVRVGLDQPFVNRSIDQLVARALALSAPVEVISYPGGHHPFEVEDDNDFSRAVMARTLDFMRQVTTPGWHTALRAASAEAAAGAALLREDWTAAVAGFGQLVAQQPKDMERQRRFGDALFGAKDYARALEAYEQAYALGHWRKRDISYPAAVAATRLNDVQAAMKWLERLVKTPFDRKRLLTDTNFAPLQNHAEFRALAEPKS